MYAMQLRALPPSMRECADGSARRASAPKGIESLRGSSTPTSSTAPLLEIC